MLDVVLVAAEVLRFAHHGVTLSVCILLRIILGLGAAVSLVKGLLQSAQFVV
jgi:hypothetical protein